MSTDNRRHERYPVHFTVRFATAVDFVTEYADNLSAGGLFVRGAHTLEPLSEIEVELDLPGYGQFRVRGRVAHIVGPEVAARAGRRPGAGVELVEPGPELTEALSEYLRRLGRRRDVAVVVEPGAAIELLGAAGFRTIPLPPADELVSTLARSEHPVLAVIVSRAREPEVRRAAEEAGVADLVQLLDHEEEVDELLAVLDQLL